MISPRCPLKAFRPSCPSQRKAKKSEKLPAPPPRPRRWVYHSFPKLGHQGTSGGGAPCVPYSLGLEHRRRCRVGAASPVRGGILPHPPRDPSPPARREREEALRAPGGGDTPASLRSVPRGKRPPSLEGLGELAGPPAETSAQREASTIPLASGRPQRVPGGARCSRVSGAGASVRADRVESRRGG